MAPASSELNLDLLIKLLKMMASNNDAEALMAARKATQQIAKVGGDWDALLRGKVTIIADPFSSASAPPPPQKSDWTPNINRKPAAPPPPHYSRPAPPPPPPHYSRDYTYTPPPSQPRPSTTTVPPRQTAVVNFTLRGGEWILSSSERLDGFNTVIVIRKDGTTTTSRVGSFIETKFGRFLYNTGKTNQKSVNDLAI